jgi:hypothetical protein
MTEVAKSDAQRLYEASEQRRCELYPGTLGYVPWGDAPDDIKGQYRKAVGVGIPLEELLEYARTRVPK